MPKAPTNYVYTDPRTFDGSEYEAADRAAEQLLRLLELALTAIEDVNVMARNAELSRQVWSGLEPNAKSWVDHPQFKRLQGCQKALESSLKTLEILQKAFAFDPVRPPKE